MKNKLKIHRVAENLTQEELADKLGVSRQTIIAIESNRYLPSITLAFKIALFFKVNIEDIFIYQQED
ncbi:helix-turn-helix transcriptional regulator [Patescibacteria group bacterium]|nr:helix-turn-helix transcriptional regulator [Patescibacteria group bacterium]